MNKQILAVALLALATIAQAQIYSYNITVELGNTPFDTHDGKLSATFEGGSGRYTHKMTLSSSNEPLFSGARKQYITAAPFPIEYVEQVVLEWKSKGFHMTTHKIYVDRVTVDPAYIPNYQQRQMSIRPYCSAQRPQQLKEKEQIKFWIRC